MITLFTVQEDTPESNADDQEEEATALERKPAPKQGRRGREMTLLTSLKRPVDCKERQKEIEGRGCKGSSLCFDEKPDQHRNVMVDPQGCGLVRERRRRTLNLSISTMWNFYLLIHLFFCKHL